MSTESVLAVGNVLNDLSKQFLEKLHLSYFVEGFLIWATLRWPMVTLKMTHSMLLNLKVKNNLLKPNLTS